MNISKSRIKSIISEEHDIMIREKETGPVSKGVHTVLDLVGLVPGWGEWADVVNAAMHAKEGNYLLASLSAISVIPIVGDAIGKGGKVTLKLRRLFPKAMKQVEKYAPEVVKGVRGLRATVQRNKGKIDKLLDLLEEEGHLSEYIDEIRMAINVLASSEETDESIAEKISGEMFKPDAAIWDDARLKTPDEEEIKAVAQVRVSLSKKKGDEEEDEEDEAATGVGSFTSSSGAGGSSVGFMSPFDSKGNIRPEFMKFEGSKIDDMIREEMNKLAREKNKKNLEKKKMREEQLEEIVRMVLKEISTKKAYKRDEKDDEKEPWWYKEDLLEEDDEDKSELDEAEIGAPNTNCTPGQPGQTCADAFNMGAISEDEYENKPPESALRKLAGSDAIHKFLLLRDENKSNAGSWIVKKLGDRVELRPTVDFAEALSKWFIKNERDPDWTIEFREESEADPISEAGGLGGHLDKGQVAEEFQEAIKTALRGLENEEVTQIFNAWMVQDDVPTLTREALRNMLQEEFENIMSEDDSEGIATGLEDVKPLDTLLRWLQKQSPDNLNAWQESLLGIDGKERVKIGDYIPIGGILGQHTIASGMIAYAIQQAMR